MFRKTYFYPLNNFQGILYGFVLFYKIVSNKLQKTFFFSITVTTSLLTSLYLLNQRFTKVYLKLQCTMLPRTPYKWNNTIKNNLWTGIKYITFSSSFLCTNLATLEKTTLLKLFSILHKIINICRAIVLWKSMSSKTINTTCWTLSILPGFYLFRFLQK